MRRFASKTKSVLVAGALVLAGAALGAVAPAIAGGSTPAAPASGGSSPAVGAPAPLPRIPVEQQGPLFGVVHGELELTKVDGTTMSLVSDRGMITAVADGEITLVRADGQTVVLGVDDQTWVRVGLQLASLGDLATGDRGLFFSERTDTGTLHAVLIACLPAGFAPGSGAA